MKAVADRSHPHFLIVKAPPCRAQKDLNSR